MIHVLLVGISGLCGGQRANAPVPSLLSAGWGVRGQRQHRGPSEGCRPPGLRECGDSRPGGSPQL